MTNAEFYRRALEVFAEVCDLSPDERAPALDRLSGGNKDLRSYVEMLLAQDASESAPIPETGFGAGAAAIAHGVAGEDRDASAVPERIGGYRIVREVGRGGMGVVYEAEQDSPRRTVALKVVRQGFASRQMLRRFEHEAQVLGQLDHRGIAQIYEAGSAHIGESAWPFFAMEHIDGKPLDEHVRDRLLGIREIIELCARVCDAVQHAHQRGIIHRDLKPGNILVKEEATATDAGESTGASIAGGSTFVDALGQPKILDFGIARVTDSDIQATTMQTNVGQIVGTLTYMAPEQLEGASADLDTRCDIYAIGVILYRLLGARLPHDLAGKPIAEAARILREEEPRLLGSLDSSLRGDIETIVSKAMEKERERRYASAAELAEDLRRFLRDQPVMARAPSRVYLAKKFTRRNKTLVSGVAATLVALIAGLVVTSLLLMEVSRERDAAEAATRRSEQVARFQRDLLRGLEPADVGDAIEAQLIREHNAALEGAENADEARAAFEDSLAEINETNLARTVLTEGIVSNSLRMLEQSDDRDPLLEAEIRTGLGEVLHELGQYEQAVRQFEVALDLRGGFAPGSNRASIDLELRVGRGLVAMHRYAAAVPRLEAIHRELLERYGSEDRATLSSAKRLGQAYRGNDQPEQAIEIQRWAVNAARDAGNLEWLALALNELGVLMLDALRYEEAMACLDEFLEISDANPGMIDASTKLDAINNVMAVMFRSGRIEDAERYARQTIPLYAAQDGDEHPNTILARNNHSRVLMDLGRTEEALSILEPEHELAGRVLPESSGARQAIAINLIEAYLWLGRAPEAEAAAREMVRIRREDPGARAGAIAQSLEQWGLCLLELGRYTEAEQAFRECIALRESIDPDHWLTHKARSELGASLAAQSRLEEAGRLLRDSAEAIDRLSDSISPNMREREVRAARERLAALDEIR